MRLILNEYFQELSKQKDNKELKKIQRLGKKISKQDDITKIQCCLH